MHPVFSTNCAQVTLSRCAAGAVHVFATAVMVQNHTCIVHALSTYKTVRSCTLQVLGGAAALNTTDCCAHSKRRNGVSVEIQAPCTVCRNLCYDFSKMYRICTPGPSNCNVGVLCSDKTIKFGAVCISPPAGGSLSKG